MGKDSTEAIMACLERIRTNKPLERDVIAAAMDEVRGLVSRLEKLENPAPIEIEPPPPVENEHPHGRGKNEHKAHTKKADHA